MQSKRAINLVECHAEGEVGDVIVGGITPPPGKTIWEQSRFIAKDETLRNFVLNEPRGGVFRHVNLLVPPKHPEADAAEIIASAVDRAVERSGAVVIPAFAVDRTEVVLWHLDQLVASGRVPSIPIYVDSPMALRALEVYRSEARRGSS